MGRRKKAQGENPEVVSKTVATDTDSVRDDGAQPADAEVGAPERAAAASVAVVTSRKMSGWELAALLRQQRREQRLKEKGY